MGKISESFCTSCQWHGEGEGLTDCPICGAPITFLEADKEVETEKEEYPENLVVEEDY